MKVVGIIVGIILIVAIGFMLYKTVVYMWDSHYTLGDSITFAWDDLINLRISRETRKRIENLASRDAEYGIEYRGLRILE